MDRWTRPSRRLQPGVEVDENCPSEPAVLERGVARNVVVRNGQLHNLRAARRANESRDDNASVVRRLDLRRLWWVERRSVND